MYFKILSGLIQLSIISYQSYYLQNQGYSTLIITLANVFSTVMGFIATVQFYKHYLGLEEMPGNDLVFLKNEKRETPCNLVSLMELDKKIGFEQLKEQVYEKSIKKHPMMRSVIVKKYGEYFYKKVSVETVMKQIQIYKDIKNEEELKIALIEVGQTPLELDQPLFNIYYIQNYKENQSAIIIRIHHVIADGPSSFATVCSMADNYSSKLLPPIRSISQLQHFIAYISMPIYGMTFIFRLVSMLVLRGFNKQGMLGNNFQNKKTWSESQQFNLNDVKQRCKQLSQENNTSITINDFLMSILQQSCKSYLVENNIEAPKELLALTPFTLQNFENITLSNKVNMIAHKLPLISELENGGIKKVRNQLHSNYSRFLEIMASSKLMIFYNQHIPEFFNELGDKFFGKNVDYICTNVPGPKEKLEICGAKVEDVKCVMPHNKAIGFITLITSYAGKVKVSIVSDEGFSKVEELNKFFEKHMNEQISKVSK